LNSSSRNDNKSIAFGIGHVLALTQCLTVLCNTNGYRRWLKDYHKIELTDLFLPGYRIVLDTLLGQLISELSDSGGLCNWQRISAKTLAPVFLQINAAVQHSFSPLPTYTRNIHWAVRWSFSVHCHLAYWATSSIAFLLQRLFHSNTSWFLSSFGG